jgi:hypothetical protein
LDENKVQSDKAKALWEEAINSTKYNEKNPLETEKYSPTGAGLLRLSQADLYKLIEANKESKTTSRS